jgi:hypothetical protein
MKFSGISARMLHGLGVATVAAILALAGCGGGTEIQRFHPTRILAFGDESSVILKDGPSAGRKYTVNGVQTTTTGVPTTTILCTIDPLWIQVVANNFGLAFDECVGGAGTSSGRILAQVNADVAHVTTQIDTFMAVDEFSHNDIVTVMAGQNDVLQQYALYPATQEDTLAQTLAERGKLLAQQVNRVAISGAAVIVVRIPDVGLTPFGQAQGTANAALLSRLTSAFNSALQLNLINDGHLIGLVFGDAVIKNIHDFPVNMSDVSNAACRDPATLDLPNCTNQTLTTGATETGWLWAGSVELGPVGHLNIGNLAAQRATSNPF